MAKQEYHYPQSLSSQIWKPSRFSAQLKSLGPKYFATAAADHLGELSDVLYAHRIDVGNVPEEMYAVFKVQK